PPPPPPAARAPPRPGDDARRAVARALRPCRARGLRDLPGTGAGGRDRRLREARLGPRRREGPRGTRGGEAAGAGGRGPQSPSRPARRRHNGSGVGTPPRVTGTTTAVVG